jgi:hypothetical protein
VSVGDNKTNQTDATAKAVAMDKTGVVHVIHDDILHTVRRPKWGQYKRIRDMFKDLAPLDQARSSLVVTAQNEDAPADERSAALDKLLDLTDELAEAKVGVIKLIFNGHPGQDGQAANADSGEPARPAIAPFKALADIPLNDDPGEWEAWLLADEELLPKILDHWRSVPLVPSAR